MRGETFQERLLARLRGRRERGLPTSSNRASSMHLAWVLPPAVEVVEAAAVLTVITPPVVPRLYFWALQASFVDGATAYGAAHLGLQWHPAHPGSTAVNFGGYRRGEGEMQGSTSPRPSARGNPNTRDFTWEPGRPYRLTIARAGDGEWAGAVDGEVIRTLLCPGRRLGRLTVWAEVFARCDDPSVEVRWSGLEAGTGADRWVAAERARVSYQAYEAGGCTNTTVRTVGAGDGVRLVTNARREVRAGTVVALRAL